MSAFLESKEAVLSHTELVWPTDADLNNLGDKLIGIFRDWESQWRKGELSSSTCVSQLGSDFRAEEVEAIDWLCFTTPNGAEFWLGFGEARESLSMEFAKVCGVYGSDRLQYSELMRVVGEKILDDLLRHIVQSFSLSPKKNEQLKPQKNLFENWSGAVVVRTEICGCTATVVVNSLMRKILSQANLAGAPRMQTRQDDTSSGASLRAVTESIRNHRLSLNVRLSDVEIDLGTLEQLQIGDVIPLPHALSETLKVFNSDGELVCNGFLGKIEDQKALELMN